MSKLLVVDDDELNREIYRRNLESAGYQVTVAASGEAALKRLDEEIPDLIILDVHMPGMDGFEVCRRIRSQPTLADVPILFITAKYHDDVSMAQGLRLGANDYLAKPFNATELVARVESVAIQGSERIVLRRRTVGLTEEVEAKADALLQSERRFREVVEHAADAICLIDKRGRFTEANRQTCRLLGCDREALLSRRAVDFFASEEYASLRDHVVSELKQHGTVEFCCEVRGAGQESISVEVSASVLGGELLVLARDIRERLALEEGLRRADRLQAIGELSSGLVHEIRNPLTGIVATLSHWQHQGDLSPKRQEAVARMLVETTRVEELLNSLLDYARPRAPHHQEVSIRDLFSQVASFIEAQLEEAKVTLSIVVEPEGLTAVIDPHQLEQVLLNLCLNAVQSMAGGGGLHLLGARLPDGVKIEVRDTGGGIAAEDLPHIFQPFFTTKHRGEGSGLGLALVQRIVQDHGGEVTVESAPGRGTTFSIHLPTPVHTPTTEVPS